MRCNIPSENIHKCFHSLYAYAYSYKRFVHMYQILFTSRSRADRTLHGDFSCYIDSCFAGLLTITNSNSSLYCYTTLNVSLEL